MTRTDPATIRQVQAADPRQSTWLSANAGSGKTKVLIDRVARLLLSGTEPQRVLCLTYTKAAASEMQNRLFDRLGRWAMLAEPELRLELRTLGIEGVIDAGALAGARRLFARAIETPGGLKIQTIHSFCAGLLRRFPLEARVSPNFTELDDRTAKLLRAEIVDSMAAGDDPENTAAFADVFTGAEIDPLLAEISRNADSFLPPMPRDAIWEIFGLSPEFDAATLLNSVFLGGEAELLAELVPLLAASGTNDGKAAEKLAHVDVDARRISDLGWLESVFLFTGSSKKAPHCAKIGSFPTKQLAEGAAKHLMPQLDAFMRRIEAARPQRLALLAAQKTLCLHRFAASFLPRYRYRKAQRGWLDFDDLIQRAQSLLSDRSVAQWVLYRLDGGIDHILVDEAQDTAPLQWKVIEHLAEEFTVGRGARDVDRTIFVVGDKKQSIYSFQGADLRKFDAMQDHFAAKYRQVGASVMALSLEHSFRSSAAILDLVDLTFDERLRRGLGGPTKHIASHVAMPGRVDLWPVVEKADRIEPGDWFDPLDTVSEQHESVRLARQIAAEISRMIGDGVQIGVNGKVRPVHEGDFLILVQRRSLLFGELIRACKAANLRIAGADRLKLASELAVKDLAALLSFLATPEDDLSLAVILRSPLFGWSEGQLYNLAQPRAEGRFLWAELRDRAAEFPETLAILDDLRGQVDFLRPFELIERALTRHGGRARLLARLGPEAEDGIAELLNQALAFESTHVPSLTGFLIWLETDDVEVKRRLDSDGTAIRVMTVHGAKGLESPIVILPDTAKRVPQSRDAVLMVGQGAAVWSMNAQQNPPVIDAARAENAELRREEDMRLLYVAMTRAQSWLITCAAGDVGEGADSWYALVSEGMAQIGAERGVLLGPGIVGLRHQHGTWPPDLGPAEAAPSRPSHAELPLPSPEHWLENPPPAAPAPDRPVSPSALGGAKVLPGEAEALDEEAAKRRGRQIHLLLEHLPLWPETEWQQIATRLLAQGDDQATSTETGSVLAECRTVLGSAAFKPYLSDESLSEVEVTAPLVEFGGRIVHGVIDRLVVDAKRVIAIDYKSNVLVPCRPEDVPEGLMRQMGAYHAILTAIYPDKTVDVAILWTRDGTLMRLSPEMMRSALLRATIP